MPDNWDGVMAPSLYSDRLPAGSRGAYYGDSVLVGQFVGNQEYDYGFVARGENSVFVCPTLRQYEQYTASNGMMFNTISQNIRIANEDEWRRIHAFREPARLGLLVDGDTSRFHLGSGSNPPNEGTQEGIEGTWSFGTTDSRYNWRKRHFEGTNVGFLDGHAIYSKNFRNDTKTGKYILDE